MDYIESPVLNTELYGTAFTNFDGWYFCANGLRDHFELPKNVSKIQFRAYKKPGRDRAEVSFMGTFYNACIIDGILGFLDTRTMGKIHKLRGRCRHWYVKLYYWI